MAHHAIGAALLGAGAGAGVIDAVYLAVPEGRSSTSAWVGIASLATAGGGIALLVKDEPPPATTSARGTGWGRWRRPSAGWCSPRW